MTLIRLTSSGSGSLTLFRGRGAEAINSLLDSAPLEGIAWTRNRPAELTPYCGS